ncbi:MAG: hypothetical protein P8N53_05915 [Paracoccaceae bacterium]|nr:hypothetical protein [Paracoccaceae bacterium]
MTASLLNFDSPKSGLIDYLERNFHEFKNNRLYWCRQHSCLPEGGLINKGLPAANILACDPSDEQREKKQT